MSTKKPNDEEQGDVGVVTRTKPKQETKKPKLYKVVLHNDHYTTMEFVVAILMTVFHKSETESTTIMLHIHRNGMGVAGLYPHDIAEAKVKKVTHLARESQFPLLCTAEPE